MAATLTTLIAWAWRKPSFKNVPRSFGFKAGTLIRTSISSGWSAVLRTPRKNSAQVRVRSPRSRLARVKVASMAHSGAMVSLAGLAVMQLPATVPRLRICGAPTSQQARARGKAWATASEVPTT